jgi:hypothetical protein
VFFNKTKINKSLLLFLLLCFIQFTTVVFYAKQIFNIQFSFIGDEYAFYNFAHDIALNSAHPNPLALNGVYGEFPVLGSYYQGIFMKFFGSNIFGWKLSSIFIIFPLGIFFFTC